MTALWVPPTVDRRLREERERRRAELIEMARRDKTLDVLNQELAKIDPRLGLIKAKDNATALGLVPGYWHVYRDNDDAPLSLLPIRGDDGEYVEPTSRILDWLRAGDLQNAQVMRARREADERELARRERAREADRTDRIVEITERWKAVSQTSISMNDSAPWSQNVAGRRR